MKRKAIIAVIICMAFGFVADSAKAIILDVNIFPEQPTINDEITIITYGQALYRPVWIDGSGFSREGNFLLLDIFLHGGALPAVTPYSHTENIGILPAGLYDLTVRTFETEGIDFIDVDTYSTTFEVIPEPATLLLLGLGFAQILNQKKSAVC